MNFQPLITRKELAAKAGISVRTLTDKYGDRLEAARSKAIDKPVCYFAQRAVTILVKSDALAPQSS